MNYLLDTHAFFWLVAGSSDVPPAVSDVLGRRSNRILISDVSAFEVTTKVRLGKFEVARELAGNWSAAVTAISAETLPVTTSHALLAGSLDWAHRDPFDRVLVAQSLVEKLVLVTSDRALFDAPGVELLRW